MNRILLLATVLVAICACGGHSHNNEGESHDHAHIHGFTAYTDKYEFFMQHEGLQVGKKSCMTLYVTSLSDFKPAAAPVKARLNTSNVSQLLESKSGEKGIFHFDFVPENAGHATVVFEAGGESAHFHVDVHGKDDVHSHDGHTACGHSHGHDAHKAEEHTHGNEHSGKGHGLATDGKHNDVAFSKEQSWKIDFATDVVGKSSFTGVMKVAARVEPVPGNFTSLVATASGKVQFAGNVVAGKAVKAGELLFYLEGGDVTDNDAAVKFAEAESNYELAKADYERKKYLFIEKIVSERDYQATEAAYRQAEARYESMKRNFGGGRITLRSPFDGYVASLLVANGEYVEPGTPLAEIQRQGDVNIVAELPVRYAGRLQKIMSVNVELPGGEVYGMDETGARVLAVGRAADSCGMIPLTISAGGLHGVMPGSIVLLYITLGTEGEESVVVPRSAIVEEMGAFFVFVQNSPISFEKRSVEIDATDGMSVKITKGLHAGERVVTKGAVALKLSQGAAALDPHAGHVH